MLDPVRIGLDGLTFFWPVYAFLGEQLRSGNVPGWNPYQFSGVPFAADPESGWMYLPAMLIFTVLPLAAAVKVYAVLHILLAGTGTYLYGRVIGLLPAGALVSAWAVSQGGLFSDRSRCCYTHIQVAAWIPIALLGVELAVRAVRHTPRVLAWLVIAFAISQMLAGWVGQGAMYGLMLLGAYVLFRSSLCPAEHPRLSLVRLGRTLLHGIIPLLFGVGLAAPGLLPRIAYYRESNLADGYSGSAAWAAQIGGWTTGHQLERILGPSGWWPVGIVVLALGVVAITHRDEVDYVVFFSVLSVAGFILGLERHTLLHRALFILIPGFEGMHSHFPERVALIFQFGPAMLAGIGMTVLLRRPRASRLAACSLCLSAAAATIGATGLDLEVHTWIAMAVAIALLGLMWLALTRANSTFYRVIAIVLIASVLIELQLASWSNLRQGSYARVDTAQLADGNDTAGIIMVGDPEIPPRYFGYDPELGFVEHGEMTYYRHAFMNELTVALLVNNRGTLWGLADIQGYNPIQPAGYVAYFRALNRAPQEYHGSYVLPGGLNSPLLALLAPEFIVVPLTIPSDRPDLLALVKRYPQVATTSRVRVLKFTDAFPRTWIVHEVQRFDGDLTAIDAASQINFRRTALVIDEVGPLDAPTGTIPESATISDYSPDSLTVNVTSDGAGLLVLSETYAAGWTARVDGAEQDIIAVNGILRGVQVPSGPHTVTLSFEPPLLETGYVLALATLILAASGVGGAMALDRRSRRRAASATGPNGSRGADRRA